MTIELFSSLLSNAVYHCMVVLYFAYLAEPRFKKYTVVIPAVFFYVLLHVLERLNNPILNFTINILFLLSVCLLHRPLKRCLFYLAVLESLVLIADAATFYGICTIFRIDAKTALMTPARNLFGMAFTTLISIALVAVTARQLKRVEDTDIPAGFWLVHILVPVGSAYLLYYINIHSSALTYLSMVTLAIVFVINILTIVSYQQALDSVQVKLANQRLTEQTRQQAAMLTTQTELERLRHDLKNRLLPIQAGLRTGDSAQALQQVEALIGGTVSNMIWTGIDQIDYMLNYKIELCKSKGVRIAVATDLQSRVQTNYQDLSVMLGIALDNAIEACEQCGADAEITVSITTRRNTVIVSVANPYIHQLSHDRKGAFRTTKEDKRGHGFGIKSMQRLAEENDGILAIDAENRMFTVRISMFGAEVTAEEKSNLLMT